MQSVPLNPVIYVHFLLVGDSIFDDLVVSCFASAFYEINLLLERYYLLAACECGGGGCGALSILLVTRHLDGRWLLVHRGLKEERRV